MVFEWYILPIGDLHITYHLLREPGNSIELIISPYKWHYEWVVGVITPLMTRRGACCRGGRSCTWDEKETWKISPCKEGVVRGLYRGCALNYAWDTQKKTTGSALGFSFRGFFSGKIFGILPDIPKQPGLWIFKVGFFRYNSLKVWIFKQGT